MARKLGAARASPWRSHEEDDEIEKENKKKKDYFSDWTFPFPENTVPLGMLSVCDPTLKKNL
jgi:hypothetical protein